MICLQGGAEFGSKGARMDADLLRAAASGHGGPIVVTALAGAPGREYDTANRNGVRHFTTLAVQVHDGGPMPDVVAAPDARAHRDAALELVASASMVVLPGGSPSRLLEALRTTGLDGVIVELLATGRVVMGASAGAMVLCERTWLPDAGTLGPGLGLVPGCLVLPHWSDGGMSRLSRFGGPGAGITVLGLPEQSGVVVEAAGEHLTFTAAGRQATTIIDPEGTTQSIPVGTSIAVPGRMDG